MRYIRSIFLVFLLLVQLQLLAHGQEDIPPKKLHLGLIIPISGPLGFFGKDLVRAVVLARERFPEIDKLIEIHIEDSAYDTKRAVSAFKHLTSVKQIDVAMAFGGPMLNALAPLAEEQKLPFFATESERSDCKGRAFCSLFRNEEDEWGQAVWYLLRKNGKKEIGIVKNQNQFMNTFVNAIIRNRREGETVNVLLDLPPDVVDLRSHVLALRSKQVDALGVYLLPGPHRSFLAALKSMNKTYPMLFGVEEFLEEANNRGFESVVENARVIAPASTDEYRNSFRARFGESPGFYYTPAFYDFMVLLKDVLGANPDLRGADLVKLMRFDGKREGASGTFSVKVSKDGVYSYSFPIAIYRVVNNKTTIEEVVF
jgi:ABC-type branched-subunit amino acid transport system substrate-binding protein